MHFRSMTKRASFVLAVGTVALAALTPNLSADTITPTLVSVTPNGTGGFTWTYSVGRSFQPAHMGQRGESFPGTKGPLGDGIPRRAYRLRAEQIPNLAGGAGGEPEETAERCLMQACVRMGRDVEGGDQVAPPKQLSPERAPCVHRDREVHQVQRPVVAAPQAIEISGSEELRSTVHLIADHQDLLVEREARPTFRGERGVLNAHGPIGSPSPIRAKVISRIASRSVGSSISMPGFARAGRMLISAVNSIQSSRPRPG